MAIVTDITQTELIEVVTREIKSLSENLVENDYVDAIDEAQRETGFSLPVTGSAFQVKWLKERTKRHIYFALLSDNVESFKVKQISLHQKWDHLMAMVEKMDADFEKALAEDITEFAGVESYALFGTKIDAGFAYDEIGRDETYGSSNLVIAKPNEYDEES